ncbi:MAG: hypothetical protein DMG07_26325 [Acidobacteria bacterium]|nr:MAG: hypothetical protein DMG07_26325 [Acidobacteriota bacterium]
MIRRFTTLALLLSICLPGFNSPGLASPATLTVNILDPTSGALADDPLAVGVTLTSTYEVKSVTAKVEERATDLRFSSADSRWSTIRETRLL